MRMQSGFVTGVQGSQTIQKVSLTVPGSSTAIQFWIWRSRAGSPKFGATWIMCRTPSGIVGFVGGVSPGPWHGNLGAVRRVVVPCPGRRRSRRRGGAPAQVGCTGCPGVYESMSGSSHLHSIAGPVPLTLMTPLVGTVSARAVPPMLKVATSAIAVRAPSTRRLL